MKADSSLRSEAESRVKDAQRIALSNARASAPSSSNCSTASPRRRRVSGRGRAVAHFGVTRIVNFARGSLYMLGIYTAYSLGNVRRRQPGFIGRYVRFLGWHAGLLGQHVRFRGGVLCAGIVVGVFAPWWKGCCCGALSRAGTCSCLPLSPWSDRARLCLVTWGRRMLGRAPGLKGAVEIAGRRFHNTICS
jgi:hypothetical protein